MTAGCETIVDNPQVPTDAPIARAFALMRLDEALNETETALAVQPEAASLHGWRRRILANLGRFEEALSAGLLARELEPGTLDHHRHLADVALRAGQDDLAFEMALNGWACGSFDTGLMAATLEAIFLADPPLARTRAKRLQSVVEPLAEATLAAEHRSAKGAGIDRPVIALPFGMPHYAGIADGDHPEALRDLSSATDVVLRMTDPDSSSFVARLPGIIRNGYRLTRSLSLGVPLANRREAARWVAHWSLSRLERRTDANLDLLPAFPVTMGQRPFVLLFDLLSLLFQPFQPFAYTRVDAARDGLYWAVRRRLQSPLCRAIYSPYGEMPILLGAFFDCERIRAKAFVHDHCRVFIDGRLRHRPLPARPAAETQTADGSVTLLFTASARKADSKFMYRGGIEVLCLARTLMDTYGGLRLILRTPIPAVVAPELAVWARTHPRVQVAEEALDETAYHALFEAADILLSPGYASSYNSLIEAMWFGVVPVAPDVFGARDLIRDGENGLLVPPPAGEVLIDLAARSIRQDLRPRLGADAAPANPVFFHALVAAVRVLIDNPALRQRLSRQAAEDARVRFLRLPGRLPMGEIIAHALSRTPPLAEGRIR